MTSATTTPAVQFPTGQLRAGDVVLEYGMRVRLTGEVRTWDGGHGNTVYAWRGQVENLDEVLEHGLVPHTFLCTPEWNCETRKYECSDLGKWTIQGNDLATWWTERA